MRHFIARLRARSTARLLEGTRFCEEYGQVCTPSCRSEEVLERYHRKADEFARLRF